MNNRRKIWKKSLSSGNFWKIALQIHYEIVLQIIHIYLNIQIMYTILIHLSIACYFSWYIFPSLFFSISITLKEWTYDGCQMEYISKCAYHTIECVVYSNTYCAYVRDSIYYMYRFRPCFWWLTYFFPRFFGVSSNNHKFKWVLGEVSWHEWVMAWKSGTHIHTWTYQHRHSHVLSVFCSHHKQNRKRENLCLCISVHIRHIFMYICYCRRAIVRGKKEEKNYQQ